MTPEDVPDGPLCIDTDAFSFLYGRRGRHTEFRPLVDGHLVVVSFATGRVARGRDEGRLG